MHIKTNAKTNFLNLIAQGHSKDQWRILILDPTTRQILTSLINLNDLLAHDILLIQDLFEKREKTSYPAIYFIKMDDATKKQIKKDIKNEIYTSFKIFCINENGSFSVHKQNGLKITKISVDYEMTDLCFSMRQGVVLCELDRIPSFCRVMNVNPNVHLAIDDDVFVDKGIGEWLNNVFSSRPRVSDILVFDRRLDVFTPLCHFYTFQSILHDYNLIGDKNNRDKNNIDENNRYENNRDKNTRDNDGGDEEDDIKIDEKSIEGPIWEKAKFIHLAEINEFLAKKAQKLVKSIQKIDDADTKDLGRIVLEAPENIKIKKNIDQLLDLTDKALGIFENKGELIGNYEMDIVNGYTTKNKKVNVHDFLKIITDPEISVEDKTRILLLLKSTRGISDVKSEIESTGIFPNLDWIENMPHQKPKKAKKYKYEMSRYTPKIQKVLNHFFGDKKKILSFSVTEPISLRRKGFHFKAESKKIMILYFINGVTFEELRICTEVGEREGLNIVVMSNELITHREFIDNLKRDGLKN